MSLTGGAKLASWMKKMAENIATADTVKIGFLAGGRYDDGTSVPMVAAKNEFGGTVEVPAQTVEAHEVTINRRIDLKTGDFLEGGKFVTKKRSNYSTKHMVKEYVIPAHNVTTPPRPFFRRMIRINKAQWGAMFGSILKDNRFNAKKSLDRMGRELCGQLVSSIKSNDFEPLSKRTIAKKGYDQILVDTDVMWKSVELEVN